MDVEKFVKLPLGSVVTHRNTDHVCSYTRVAGGTGWNVSDLRAPYKLQYTNLPVDKACGNAVLPADAAKDVTLVLMGDGGKAPSKKDRRIAELEEEVAAYKRASDTADTEIDRLAKANFELREALKASEAALQAELAAREAEPQRFDWKNGDVARNTAYSTDDPDGLRFAINGRWVDRKGNYQYDLQGPTTTSYQLVFRVG